MGASARLTPNQAKERLKKPKTISTVNEIGDPDSNQKDGRLDVAGVLLEAEDVQRLNDILEGNGPGSIQNQHDFKREEGGLNQKLVLQQYIADAKMTALMSETISNK